MVRIMSSTHVAMYVRAKCNKQLDSNLCMVASHGSQVGNGRRKGGKATVASHGSQVANGGKATVASHDSQVANGGQKGGQKGRWKGRGEAKEAPA